MNFLPAVLIGGPPHAGKSVLAFSLSQRLRAQAVDHYVLRAYPDGEGHWSNQAEQTLVRSIRVKNWGSPEWVDYICRDIAHRHLPLIVDPGGKPTAEQAKIFDHCTHAILLTRDADTRDTWQRLVQEHGLITLADIHSELAGASDLADSGAVLRGTLTGLERGRTAHGIVFDALIERLAQLFAYPTTELRALHFQHAPTELVIELRRLGQTLAAMANDHTWMPAALPRILDYLPAATPLAIYDPGPNWLYAALALYATPSAFYQFDARLGWVSPPHISLATHPSTDRLKTRLVQHANHYRIELELVGGYLDYADAAHLTLPAVPLEQGIVLSGQLPLWLWTAAALAYRRAPWMAIYQPQLFDQAVVVKSTTPAIALGQLIASPL